MNILIADDHAVVRSGIKQILLSEDSTNNIIEVANGDELINEFNKNKYDLIITDISMPFKNGIDAITEIRKINKTIPILVLSMNDDEQYVKHSLNAGANGYVTKDAATEELVEAIEMVLNGRKFISELVAEKLAINNQSNKELHSLLSERELEIFKLIVYGIPLSTIAKKLNIKNSTVSTYRNRILEKMKMSSNSELTKYAIKHKFL